MQFDIVNEYGELEPSWLERLDEILPLYAEQEGLPDDMVIGLTFCDDDYIQEVNREHRGIDRATDVLSFPLYERDDEIELFEDELAPFGDIILSVPHAIAQAEEYGHSVEREVCYLIVHGLMHLAGYDHMEEDEKAEMREQEEALLGRLGITRDARPEKPRDEKPVESAAAKGPRAMKTGFISLIGRPNAGKSTLINQIMDRKIAIVSAKPQTTRTRITGIFTTGDAQMVFVDTPGIHKPKHRLDHYMVEAARSTIYEGDVIYYVVDASVPFGSGEQFILDALKDVDVPVFLLLNKIDLMTPEELMRTIVKWQTRREFAEIFPLSAERGDNVDRLLETSKGYLYDGPSFYPEDAVTDQPERIIMSELIREKILRLTEEEVPHSVAVVIEHMERDEKDDKLIVHAAIYTERSSQKGIIIGKQGAMIKKIGTQARRDIEELLGEKIYLKLWVRVKENWRNREGMLHDLGYDMDDFN